MAESEAVVKLNATDEGATSTIQKVGAASEAAAGSTNNLKQELRELQKELSTLDPNSEKFQELSLRAGQVKDQLSDAAEAISANAGSAFEQLSNNAGNLASRLSNLDFEGAGQSAKALGIGLGNLKFSDLTTGIKSFGSSMLDVGKTIRTNPLIIIPTLIVGLIQIFMELKDVIPGVGAAFEFIGDTIGIVTDAIKSFTDWIGITEFAATEQLEKATSERDGALGEIDRQEKRAKANARKNGEDIVAVEKEYADKRRKIYESIVAAAENKINQGLKLSKDELKNLEDANNAIYELDTADINRSADADQKAKEEQKKRDEEAQRKQEQAAAEAQRKREQARQKAEQERQRAEQERKKQEEERKQAEKKLNEDIAAIQEQQRLSKLSKDEAELIESQKKFDTLAAQAKGNADALAQIEELRGAEEEAIRTRQFEERQAQEKAREAELQAERDKANAKAIENQKVVDQLALEAMKDGLDKELALRADKFDADIAAAEGNAEAQKIITEKYIKDVQDIEAKAQEESLKKRAENIQAWGKLTADAFKAISDLDKAFRKEDEKNSRAAFNRNKAYSLAQAIIQTGLAVTAALTAGGNPIKLAKGQNFVEAGIAAAVGLAQVATIAKTQYNAGGPSGGGGGNNMLIPTASAAGGGGGGGVAQFNPLNTNFVNNRPGQVAQTYVLAGDVANAQEARNRVQDLARL